MRVEIRRIQRSLGITTVYVTHDRVEAMSLSDRVIVMKDGEIMQVGSPMDIYENPSSQFVAGFVGKVAFFPVELTGGGEHAWDCLLGGKSIRIQRAADTISLNRKAVVMARPESLRLTDQGTGIVDGKVHMNVYLGNSVESFVDTPYGQVLVQTDDPASKRIFAEGSAIAITFAPERVRLLPA
jgi:iron(III) transport system ATP-binding protein